jgi:hypothetical protein
MAYNDNLRVVGVYRAFVFELLKYRSMAKKKRANSPRASAEQTPAQPPVSVGSKIAVDTEPAKPKAKPLLALPAEIGRGDWTAIILACRTR